MSEDKIADLQRRLDEKLVDPKNLTLPQREALNLAFEDGTLTGYRSVSDMITERRLARKDIAEDVKKRLEPLAPTSLLSLGIRRGILTAAGDITGSFAPYVLSGKKLAIEARENALAGKGTSYIPEIRKESGQKSFKIFSNLLTKLPGLNTLGIFKNTSKVLDGTVQAAANLTGLSKLKFSKAATTELRSQFFGAIGAGAGSVAFDVVNFPVQYAVAAGEDIAKYDDNQINRLPFADRVAYHAADSFRTALMWNAGTFGVFSAFSGLSNLAKKAFGINTENVKRINQQIVEKGFPVSNPFLMEGLGGLPGLAKNINAIVSIVPGGAGEVLKQQQRYTAASLAGTLGASQQALNNIPLLQTEFLANVLKTTAKNTFTNSNAIYTNLYKEQANRLNEVSGLLETVREDLVRSAIKSGEIKFPRGLIGDEDAFIKKTFPDGMDLPIIPTENLRRSVLDILGQVEGSISREELARRASEGLYDQYNDVTYRYTGAILRTLDQFRLKNKADFITPKQFNDLRQGFNANYPNTKLSDTAGQKNALSILEAFANDLNYVGLSPNNSVLFEKNPKLKNAFNVVNKYLGPERANKFIDDFKEMFEDANSKLKNANAAFAESITYYGGVNMAALARKMDPAMLTAKQALDFNLPGRVTSVQSMNALYSAAFNPVTGTAEGVQDLARLIGIDSKFSKEVQDQGRFVLKALMYRNLFDALNQNAVVRRTGVSKTPEQFQAPFVEEGIDSIQEAIQILNQKSPMFRQTVEDLIEANFKLGPKGLKLTPEVLFKIQKRALSPEVIQQALKDNVPITQSIFVTNEKTIGATKLGKASGVLEGNIETGRQALKPFGFGYMESVEKAFQPQILDKGVLRDVTSAERAAARAEMETYQFRLQGYQGFRFDGFQKMTGLDTKSGREQLVTGFALANNLSKKQAVEHVENIEIMLQALKKNYYETPVGDASTYVTRAAIFALGGGGVGFFMNPSGEGFASGLLGAALFGLVVKGGAHLINSPKHTRAWNDLYSRGELLDINRINSLQPPKRAVFADMFNYVFATDPDAPKINPNNIDEEKVIKYLQGQTLTNVPTKKGLYDILPEEIKTRFNPERLKLKELKGETKKDFNTYMQGASVANFRNELIDNIDTEQGAAIASQPRVAQFIQNPMDLKVPEGAKTMQADINPVTADVYSGLFPGDSIGTTIAQSQQPRPPMMKKGGFVNVKKH